MRNAIPIRMMPFVEAQSKAMRAYAQSGQYFVEAQSKAMRAYAQSGQYHTIVESRIRLIWYQN